ncbi:putative zinc-or iron-chelating domain-containing protein [Pararobbsia alpina]|uniref:YkgJ family cysteine cluster protein n=1 Tax=Pararobbsia alpina TaxID=621374 RepID=UPI0039A4F821
MTDTSEHRADAAPAEPGLSLNFECLPECGGCCQDLRLPLTIAEAIAWLERGGKVEMLCEAIPWESEPAPDQLVAAHKRRRSFPAQSGALPVRVIVVLAARFEAGCPNLLPDMRCGIYHERPLVCRIYPAEINPFIELQPAHKMCPPHAWSSTTPFIRGGQIVDAQVAEDIASSRAADQREAPFKAQVCEELGVDIASFSTLGFAVHHPERGALLAALQRVAAQAAAADMPIEDPAMLMPAWRFSSDRPDYAEALKSVGAEVAADGEASAGGAPWERLSLG